MRNEIFDLGGTRQPARRLTSKTPESGNKTADRLSNTASPTSSTEPKEEFKGSYNLDRKASTSNSEAFPVIKAEPADVPTPAKGNIVKPGEEQVTPYTSGPYNGPLFMGDESDNSGLKKLLAKAEGSETPVKTFWLGQKPSTDKLHEKTLILDPWQRPTWNFSESGLEGNHDVAAHETAHRDFAKLWRESGRGISGTADGIDLNANYRRNSTDTPQAKS